MVSERYGIQLHALCVLSNHFHVVLTDPLGNLPRFERDLDSLVARSFNALHGRWETFWSPGSYSAVTLEMAADVVDKIAYVLNNPVEAGLVRTGSDWPGLRTPVSQIGGRSRKVKRPNHFFRKDGPTPEWAMLTFVCPPGFASLEDFRERLVAAVQEREEEVTRERAAKGLGFLGRAAVLAQKPDMAPPDTAPRRGLNPRVACKDKWKRVEVLQRLKEFRVAYRAAWEAFASGVRDALFPHGTYWMRVTYGAACMSPS